jgi:hypothetical protein
MGRLIVLAALLMIQSESALAAQKVCFLTLKDGGFTGVALPYKTCGGCEGVKKNIINQSKKRGQTVQGKCRAGYLG